jgi:aldehyde:ferredoxin oxidoreductase
MAWKRVELLDVYYHVRGWDSAGILTPEKRQELGL